MGAVPAPRWAAASLGSGGGGAGLWGWGGCSGGPRPASPCPLQPRTGHWCLRENRTLGLPPSPHPGRVVTRVSRRDRVTTLRPQERCLRLSGRERFLLKRCKMCHVLKMEKFEWMEGRKSAVYQHTVPHTFGQKPGRDLRSPGEAASGPVGAGGSQRGPAGAQLAGAGRPLAAPRPRP